MLSETTYHKGLNQSVSSVLDQQSGLVQVLQDGTRSYLYGSGRLAQRSASLTEYYLTDALGSVRQLTDASGAAVLSRSYEPYGKILSAAGAASSPYAFTGERYDPGLGLLHLRARDYAPGLGRFLNRDTWGGEFTRPLSLNRWNYVEGNPINLTDPLGLCTKGTCGPDVTKWFVGQMQDHYNYGTRIRSIRTKMIFKAGIVGSVLPLVPLPISMYVVDTPFKEILNGLSEKTNIPLSCLPVNSLFAATEVVEALGVFEYAIYGLAADYAFVNYQSDTSPCGTNGCGFFEPNHKSSATLCGHCIDASDLGNIMFGLGGAARGYNFPFTYFSTGFYNVLADWMPKHNWNDIKGLLDSFFSPDGKAGMIGWTVGITGAFFNETSFCARYSKEREITGGYENGDQASQCKACSQEYSPKVLEPSSLWRISGRYGAGSSDGTKDTIHQLLDRIGKATGR